MQDNEQLAQDAAFVIADLPKKDAIDFLQPTTGKDANHAPIETFANFATAQDVPANIEWRKVSEEEKNDKLQANYMASIICEYRDNITEAFKIRTTSIQGDEKYLNILSIIPDEIGRKYFIIEAYADSDIIYATTTTT